MWRSVPQMPVSSTRIRTSLMPIVGFGTSSIHSPRSARLFTNARINISPKLRAAHRSLRRRATLSSTLLKNPQPSSFRGAVLSIGLRNLLFSSMRQEQIPRSSRSGGMGALFSNLPATNQQPLIISRIVGKQLRRIEVSMGLDGNRRFQHAGAVRFRKIHDVPQSNSPPCERTQFDDTGEADQRIRNARKRFRQDLQDDAPRTACVEQNKRSPERGELFRVDPGKDRYHARGDSENHHADEPDGEGVPVRSPEGVRKRFALDGAVRHEQR